MSDIDLQAIKRRYGGDISGDYIKIPTPGHSKRDRGTKITLTPDHPDGCTVHSFNGGDWREIKDMLRRDGFLPDRERKTYSTPPSVDWASLRGEDRDMPAEIGWQDKLCWDYTDAEGSVLYRKKRVNKPDGSKSFIFENKGDQDHVLYRLPDLIAGEGPVFVAEGEKCADKLASWGLAATSSKDLDKCDLSALKGRRVFILPDNDSTGRREAQKAKKALKEAGAYPLLVELPGLPEKGDIMDWKDSKEDLLKLAEAAGKAAATKPAFHFTPVGQLEYRAPEFVIDGLIETDSLGLIFGDPGCGKSFLAIDLGMSVAAGVDFHGRDVKQGPVFLIAGEGHNGLARRMAAWAEDRGLESMEDVPLFKSNRAAQLLDAESAAQVTEAVAGLAENCGNPALIIIDTLARNFGSGDENSTKDMSDFVAAVDEMKAHFVGCTVLIVHHTGHSEKERARGAMALKGALDCEYRIVKTKEKVSMTNTKMKDAEPPERIMFELKTVELGEDASSAVLELTEAPEVGVKLSPNQRLARNAFIDAAAVNGNDTGDGFFSIHLNDWREEFYAQHTGDNADSKKRVFSKLRNDLQEKGLITVKNDIYVWRDPIIVMQINSQRDSGTGRDIGGTCPDAEAENSGRDGTHA